MTINSTKLEKEFRIQQDYYAKTASQYNAMHADEEKDQQLGLTFLEAYINLAKCQSLLDIGSGTGRKLLQFKQSYPNLKLLGIEPSKELREIAYESGLSPQEIRDGNGMALDIEAGKFDIVCAFNTLHHIRHSDLVISEMLRVASKAIFIMDINNFAGGSKLSRLIKQTLHDLGLWSFVDFVKTRGKGYRISEGDGLSYSYSIFNNYELIRKSCKSVHVLNTSQGGINPYRTATDVAILGIK